MVAKGEVAYLKIDTRILREYGSDVAVLYALLVFLSHRFKKDGHGYFKVFGKYLRDQSGLGHARYYRALNTLVDAGRIDYIPGHNQNTQARYKILL